MRKWCWRHKHFRVGRVGGSDRISHGVVNVAVGCGSVAAREATRQVAAAHELGQCPRRRIARLGWRLAGVADCAQRRALQGGGEQRRGQHPGAHRERRRRRTLGRPGGRRGGRLGGRGGGFDGFGVGDHMHHSGRGGGGGGLPGRAVGLAAGAAQFGAGGQRGQRVGAALGQGARVALAYAAGHLLDALLHHHRVGGVEPGPHAGGSRARRWASRTRPCAAAWRRGSGATPPDRTRRPGRRWPVRSW